MGTLSKNYEQNLTLRERREAKKVTGALLLDVSGSMCGPVEPGKKKIDVLRDIVKSLHGNPDVYTFSNEARKVTTSTIPNPHGDTDMAPALRLAKREGHNSAVVITDGDITDKVATLKEVEGFNLQILYVGLGDPPDFLDKLAKAAGGGFCTQHDLKNPKEIESKVQLLLGPPPEKKGPIAL